MSIYSNKHILTLKTLFVEALVRLEKSQHRIEVRPKFGGRIIGYDKKSKRAIEKFTISASHRSEEQSRLAYLPCPIGEVGNQLYVKESWSYHFGVRAGVPGVFIRYTADDTERFIPEHDYPQGWQAPNVKENTHLPPPTLPKVFCRFLATITEIRVERLLEISHEDAIREGVGGLRVNNIFKYQNYHQYTGKLHPTLLSPIDSYLTIWESDRGEEFVQKNPFVWVVSFDFKELL